MYRLTSAAVALLGFVVGIADAQSITPLRRLELGIDLGYQVNRGSDVSRSANAPVSVRYGAINTKYRLTIDQRATFGDRRVYGAKAPLTIDTQLGWRLGTKTHVQSTVLGPYVFGAFNLTTPNPYFKEASRNRAGFGFGGGIGARVALLQIILRPELVVAHDLGSGDRGEPYWIPPRNRVGVRLGYGYQFGIGDK